MASVSVPPTAGFKEPSSNTAGVDRLPEEMNEMKIRDDTEIEATVVDGTGTETGHIIVTTIGGRNGQPKQTISYMAERVVGHRSFGIVFQICRALAYIHGGIRVCHRDIKPQNLLVNPHTHQLEICDFGSAKVLVKGEANISYICSRYYRAPELIFGATEYTTAIDIWSAGCVLAELLLGQPLFPGESGVDQLVEIIKILHKRTPLEAVDLVSRLLQYSPNLRCTALEALIHPFFDELRDPNTRLPNGRLLPPLFNFKPHELKGVPAEIVAKLIPEHSRKQFAAFLASHS
ncbi:hypothetical protein MKW92_007129 [Papaver armeniacum]|nr:hypothetical protein MKW92_007129 [Papaver armeniacum]